MDMVNSRKFSFLMAAALTVALTACAQTTSGQAQRGGEAAAGAQKPEQGQEGQQAEAAAKEKAAPKFETAKSPDGTTLAYEVTGKGPALLLVHGGGQNRRSWNQLGYVERLAKQYTVITMDLRGSGDSDKPVTQDAYALEKVLADFTAVADAAGAKRFHLWGFGHGATLARYYAAQQPERVISAVLVGMTMGPAATGVFETAIKAMQGKWQPVLDAHAAGKLDVETLSKSDRTAWEAGIGANVASLTALLKYPPLEPTEIKVPTLWAVGSDDSAIENLKEYEPKLKGTMVTAKILSSVNYSDSFVKMEQVVGEVEPFLKKTATPTT